MSESMKPRFAVDLDEIERQLTQAKAGSAAPAARNDPLSELARIVGQDDPFQAILANDQATRRRSPDSSNLDDLFVTREDHRRPDYESGPAYERQGHHGETEASQASDYSHYHASQTPQSFDPALYENYYSDDGRAEAASQDYAIEAAPEMPVYERRRSRKGLVAIASIIGSLAIGIGGAVMLKGKTVLLASGEPPLIKAGTEPIKVPPQSPGGVEIPNQNKQIYERASSDVQTKVVNREEQPVDVRQAVRPSSAGDATGATSPAPLPIAQQSPTGGLNLGEPRKVRTVLIRPDGTVASAEPTASRSATPLPAAAPAMTLPAAAASTPTTPGSAAAVAAPRPAATTPTPRPTQVAGGSSPQPAAAPATPQPTQPAAVSPAAPQRVAAAKPAPVASAAEPAPVGGFSVQLGVSSSEADAKTTLQRLQQKYADLGGHPAMIRKAETNGNTIYRVRVGPMPRDEASSLCSKIQGQGGQCFVAKN